jgi:hypothetical protein
LVGIFKAIFGGWKLCGTDYVALFVSHYIIFISMRIALFASVISDNLLILNRLVTLYEIKQSMFYKLSKRVRTVFWHSFFQFRFAGPI